MPGNVANATASTVMPWNLCQSFERSDTWPVAMNEYHDGRRQVRRLAENSRKRWRLSHRLTAAQVFTLRAFYQARGGTLEAFYFYDVYETNPKFAYDPGGAALTGRYKVRFDSTFGSEWNMQRFTTGLSLVEVA